MASERGKYAHNFKRSGPAVGVDRRAVRAHRRSMEWKQSRDEVVARKRNVSPSMSPVPEAKAIGLKLTNASSTANDRDKAGNRKAQLMKWKKEKELRKKMDEREKAKKKPFRVVHLEQETVAFQKGPVSLPKVTPPDTASGQSKASASGAHMEIKGRATSSRTKAISSKLRGSASQDAAATAYATRSKSAPSGPIEKKTSAQRKANTVDNGKGKGEGKASTKAAAAAVGKDNSKTKKAVHGRATRSTAVLSDIQAFDSKPPEEKPLQVADKFVDRLSSSRLNKVTMKRGAESFAPIDFQFTAPENLVSLSFNKANNMFNVTPSSEDKLESSQDLSNSASFGVVPDKQSSSELHHLSSALKQDFQAVGGDVQTGRRNLDLRVPKDCFVLLERISDHSFVKNDENACGKNCEYPISSLQHLAAQSLKKNNKTRPASSSSPPGSHLEDQKHLSLKNDEIIADRPHSMRKRKSTSRLEFDIAKSSEDPNPKDEVVVVVGSNGRRSVSISHSNKANRHGRRSALKSAIDEAGLQNRDTSEFKASVRTRRSVHHLEHLSDSNVDHDASSFIDIISSGKQAKVKASKSRRKSSRKSKISLEIDETNDIEPVTDDNRDKGTNNGQEKGDIICHTPSLSGLVLQDEQKEATASVSRRRKSVRKSIARAVSDVETNISGANEEQNIAAMESDASGVVYEPKSLSKICKTNDKVPSFDDAVFQTPAQSSRPVRKRFSVATPSSIIRKTPKNVRNSLILRALSPEEGIEVLKNSPMIELNRRKMKTPPSSTGSGNDDVVVAQLPSFDDINVNDLVSASLENSFAVPSTVAESPPLSDLGSSVEGEQKEENTGVKYFRDLLSAETDRLSLLCSTWKNILAAEVEKINDDVSGQIRTTIGQAELLMAQRFKQFSGLVDDSEFKTSEKEVTSMDLQGFWEMIYYQVEDVNKKFDELDRLKASDWVAAKPVVAAQKKVLKKKANGTKPADAKKNPTRPNFAEFRKKKLLEQENEKISAKMNTDSVSNEVKTSGGKVLNGGSSVKKSGDRGRGRRSVNLEEGNTPKGTPLVQSAQKKMARKSLILSMQKHEQNSLTPSDKQKTNPAEASPGVEVASVPRDGERDATPVSRQQQSRSKKSKRKSVSFSNVVRNSEALESEFSKYLLPSSSDLDKSPEVIPAAERDPLLASLANVDEDDVPVKVFKGLNMGFTPGTDRRSRRISCFTPLASAVKSSVMTKICEQVEPMNSDLMTFSPAIKSDLPTEVDKSARSKRKSHTQSRRSTRRSVADVVHQSAL